MKARDMKFTPGMEMHIEKLLHSRMTSILSDRVLMRIWQRLGGEVFRRSSVLYGLDEFLTRCKVKGGTVVEIGTRHGLTAVVLARHFDHVITMDVEKSTYAQEVFSLADVSHKVMHLVIGSNEEKKEILNHHLVFDFAYLDGNHADDTMLDWGLTKKCGRVLFQEAWEWQKPVWDLVRSLPQDEVRYFHGSSFALWMKK